MGKVKKKKRRAVKLPRGLEPEEVELLRRPFREVPDPRRSRSVQYGLFEIIIMSLFAVICGADGFIAIATWSESYSDWLSEFLDLPNGTPSHDTFTRVLSSLDPDSFTTALYALTEMLVMKDESKKLSADVVALDGKCLRRSFDTLKEKSAFHLLSAFNTAFGLVLGQSMVDSKTNEITVIPELLKRLDIKGKTVTLDAMGCQYKICDQIIEQEADFVIGLKGNQGSVRKACEERLAYAEQHLFDTDIKGEAFVQDEVIETPSSTEHGRIETRRVTAITPSEYFYDTHPQWKTIQSFVRVISERIIQGVVYTETRFFIASLLPNHVAMVRDAIRAHWMIENRLHWSLDTTFREDDSRIRTGSGPHVMAALKRAALGILKNTPSKDSLKIKRQKAGWNHAFLLKSLRFS